MSEKKILLVDDDKDLLRALHVRLTGSGYDVVVAPDGFTAIKVAQEEKPDLIILDIGLPAGDGFTVMDRLKDILPLAYIPIIILTAREPEPNKEQALKAGAIAFFQKPVDNNVLLAAIRKALGESRVGMQKKR